MKELLLDSNKIKLYKRYSPVGFFYCIFCFLLIGLPVASLFIPLNCIFLSETAGMATFKGQITGLDLITKSLLFKENDIVSTVASLGELGLFKMAFPVAYLVIAIFLIISLFFSLILAIKVLLLFLTGQTSNPKSISSLSWFVGITNILYFGLLIAIMFGASFVSQYTGYAFGIGVELLVYVFAGASLLLPIIISIYYGAAYSKGYYKNCVKILGEMPEGSTPTITKTVKVNSVLPKTISQLGGHAFSGNLDLEVAEIPFHITSIGTSCFSNCGKLHTVIIPNSVISIGANAFFNCVSLKTIIYDGSKQEWSKIQRGSNWLLKAGTDVVGCSDGPIRVNPIK